MFTIHKSLILTVAAACLPFVSGCMQDGSESGSEAESEAPETESVESNLDLIDPVLLIDGCKTAAADKTYYLTSTTGTLKSQSPDGGYRYSTADLCGRWVVDFKFGTTAPERVLAGLPYDLPSSAGALGTWPNNAYDCQHLRLLTTVYRKKSTETAFTQLATKSSAGIWSAGSCYAPSAIAYGIHSTLGYDTYRVAVAVKLRGAWQQAAAVAEYPPVP